MSRQRQPQPQTTQDRNFLAEFNSEADSIINGGAPAPQRRAQMAGQTEPRQIGHDPMALVRLQSKAQNTISELQQTLKETVVELTSLSDEHERLEAVHETQTAELGQITTRIREIETSHATALGAATLCATTAEAKVTGLEAEKTTLTEQVETLKAEKTALEAQIVTLTQEKADLQLRVTDAGAADLGLPVNPAPAPAAAATAAPAAAPAATAAPAPAVVAGASTQIGDPIAPRVNMTREQVAQQVALNADPSSPQGQEAILRQAVATWHEWQVKLNKGGTTKTMMAFQKWYAGENYDNVQLGLARGYHLRQTA